MELSALGRHPAPSDLAPGREARPRRVPVRRLARGRRPVVVAGAAARAARRVRLAVPVAAPRSRPRPQLLAQPDGAGHGRRGRGLRRAPSATGPAAGRASPAPRRSPTRCASSGSGRALRAYAAERGVRLIGDLPIYVVRRRRRHRGLAGAVRARRGRRRAARRAQPRPASSGATRCTTGPRTARPATAGGCERFRRTFELVDLCRVDHFRGFVSYWAIPGAEQDGEARPLAARARAPSSSTRSSASSATCR